MTRVTEVATTAAIVIVTYLALVFELLPVPQTFQEEIVPVVRIKIGFCDGAKRTLANLTANSHSCLAAMVGTGFIRIILFRHVGLERYDIW